MLSLGYFNFDRQNFSLVSNFWFLKCAIIRECIIVDYKTIWKKFGKGRLLFTMNHWKPYSIRNIQNNANVDDIYTSQIGRNVSLLSISISCPCWYENLENGPLIQMKRHLFALLKTVCLKVDISFVFSCTFPSFLLHADYF